jgi:thiol:disulfide interchange protein DsbC
VFFMSKVLLAMKKSCVLVLFVHVILMSHNVLSQPIAIATEEPQAEGIAVSKALSDVIFAKLRESRSDLQLTNLRPSPLPGLYKIDINGQLAFVSESGEFLIAGEMYQASAGGLVNLQERDRLRQEAAFAPTRAERLAAIDQKEMVIYRPEKAVKGHVYVFTDIDCGFCRKLHGQMDEMLEQGIEVRYLAFPRAGANSRSAEKLATTWCADDRQQTMSRFKQGENVELAVCGSHPVADQYMLGKELGVRGTPAIILESGKMIPGAVSTARLVDEMGI